MPRKKKQPQEWTTEEVIKRLFPKKVVEHVKREANPPEKPQVKPFDESTKDDDT